MYKYKELLFGCPIPFTIIRYEDNNYRVKESNINFEEDIYAKIRDIENNDTIQSLVKATIKDTSKTINIKNIDVEYELESQKLSENEVIIWFKIKEEIIKEQACDISHMNFLSNLIHEFKTPLNLIFSSMQLLNKKIDNDNISKGDISKYLNIINQNSYRMLKLVNNIVDDSKIDIGHDEYNPINHDIVSFIENICESIDSFIKLNNMTLIFDTDIEELVVAFDMEKIERIILNLISNAIKFRKEDEGNILLKISSDDEFVNIAVKDNGIGISKENIKKIFGKYVRLNDERSMIKEGTGIGLSLVESLVKLHNGSVSVNSSFGNWTEFIVKIPNIKSNKKLEYSINSNELDRVEKIKIEFSDIYS
ncbi:HAMP domain-containing sensor histidine kinase [Clostridium sp. CCUG 7971]|uniref:sensor histidine kinase n=1 Tax=Clostridium sp. CCUG 7971 TaxID=2811414 RepID=UPI001ABBCEE5|nr:HAMP domain-containing sensor histidine kinase [Clostridium sp. CCUG 7971]MBO3444877.1 HAMP domain-containing histidine kinase [Clostridium sp. CCUG 7971]